MSMYFGFDDEDLKLLGEGLHHVRGRAKDRMDTLREERCDKLLRLFGLKPQLEPKKVFNNAEIDEVCVRARTRLEKLQAAYGEGGTYGVVKELCDDTDELLAIMQYLRDEFGKLSRVVGELLEENRVQQERHMQNLRDIRQSLGEDKPRKRHPLNEPRHHVLNENCRCARCQSPEKDCPA